MRIAYWINKAPNTDSEYVILTVSPGNDYYAHALQHSVTSTFPVFYLFSNATNHIQQNQNNIPNAVTGPLFS